MHIENIHIQNFRCFADTTIPFSRQFNALIGDNGSGKSAVLDALSVGVGAFLLGIDQMPSRNIGSNDVRLVRRTEDDIPTVEQQYPVRITLDGILGKQPVSWNRTVRAEDGKTTRSTARSIKAVAADLQQKVRSQETVTLPLIAYYGTGRMWYQGRRLIIVRKNGEEAGVKGQSPETIGPGSRLAGYENCLSAETNQRFLTKWLRTLELSSLQRRSHNSTLVGLKSAVNRCMDTWKNLTYDVLLHELVVEDNDGELLPIRFLSDGQRNVLFMVLDIAYRASTLNPHFNGDACNKTPGVVLVDEIDLHLHPNWQRRIVDDLRETFPQLQFIVSTHSPQIIQSLRKGELIDLGPSPLGEYVGKSPEDILENVMDVDLPQRSERSKRMIDAAEEYYKVLRQDREATSGEQLIRLKQDLDKLSEPFADNEAYIAFLRQERLTNGM